MGQVLETVTVQHERAKAPKTIRISKRVKAALEQMAFNGYNRGEAAQIVGLAEQSLRSAMRKSHVKAYMNQLQRVLREGEAFRSVGRIAKLADEAESETVRLQANNILLGLEGDGPLVRQQTGNPLINQVNLPGLTIVYQEASSTKRGARADRRHSRRSKD